MIKIILKDHTINGNDRKRIKDFCEKYSIDYVMQVGYTQEDLDYLQELVDVRRILRRDAYLPKGATLTPNSSLLRRLILIDYDKKRVLTSFGTEAFSGTLRELIPRKTREIERQALYEKIYQMEMEEYDEGVHHQQQSRE